MAVNEEAISPQAGLPLRSGHHVEDVHISGAARVHIGDVFNINNTSTSDEHRQCLDALFLTDPRADRDTILVARGEISKGTCEWITSLDEYKAWFAGNKSNILWICGQPGQGKTYLSIYLAKILRNSKNAHLLEFYCDNKDYKRNTASAILRGLMFELLVQLPELSQCLKSELDYKTHKLRDDSFAALWVVFGRMIQLSGKSVFLVLDGLDECEETSIDSLVGGLAKMLETASADAPHIASTYSHLRVVLTSRQLSKSNSKKLSRFPNISLGNNLVQGRSFIESDVGIFVETEFSEYFSMDSLTEYFDNPKERDLWCDEIKVKLVEMANGTFLWAGFAMRQLRDATPPTVEDILNNLPQELDAMYDRILLQIEETCKEKEQTQIAALLQWVVLAIRPMSLSEISAALFIDRRGGFRKEAVVRDLVTSCRGLLVIAGETVSLVHQTVKDYLVIQDSNTNAARNRFGLKENDTHKNIAQACISYLQNGSLGSGPILEGKPFHRRIRDAVQAPFPLLSYSTLNWSTHARLSEQDIFDSNDIFFAEVSTARNAWLSVYWQLERGEDPPEQFSLLHVAATFNLLVLAEQLLNDVTSLSLFPGLNSKDSEGETPLSRAAWRGHEAMARLLLKKGAEVDVRNRFNRTALYIAAQEGYEAVVSLLLKNGADIDAKGRYGMTPLWVAADMGHQDVLTLLVKNGANTEPKNGLGHTPLLSAAGHNQKAMVTLLLENGADIEAKDPDGRTPVLLAAKSGHAAVVELLIERGATWTAEDLSRLPAQSKTMFPTVEKHSSIRTV